MPEYFTVGFTVEVEAGWTLGLLVWEGGGDIVGFAVSSVLINSTSSTLEFCFFDVENLEATTPVSIIETITVRIASKIPFFLFDEPLNNL